MPQKRNPYALAVIRTQAGIAAGDLAAMLVALHTGSARTDHFHLLNGSVPRALEEAVAVTRLAAEVVGGLTIDAARWERAAREGFTAAADVADVLAVEAGLDYRTAHHVVGRAVRDLVEAGLAARRPHAGAPVGRRGGVDGQTGGDLGRGPRRCPRSRGLRGRPAADGLGRSRRGRRDDRRVPRRDRRRPRGQRGGAGAGDSGGDNPPGTGPGSVAMTNSVRTLSA